VHTRPPPHGARRSRKALSISQSQSAAPAHTTTTATLLLYGSLYAHTPHTYTREHPTFRPSPPPATTQTRGPIRATYGGLCGITPACGQASRGMWCLRHAGALAWRRGPVCARVLVPPNLYIHTYINCNKSTRTHTRPPPRGGGQGEHSPSHSLQPPSTLLLLLLLLLTIHYTPTPRTYTREHPTSRSSSYMAPQTSAPPSAPSGIPSSCCWKCTLALKSE